MADNRKTEEWVAGQRGTSVKFLQLTGLPAVPVTALAKHPVNGWDVRSAAIQDNGLITEAFLKGQWNLGALMMDRWVDLDVDTEDKLFVAALDRLLPPSDYVWGRTGKRRSHRAYYVQAPLRRAEHSKILTFLKQKTGYSIEIRGGEQEAAMHSILPGSVYVDGGFYEWDRFPNNGVSPQTYPVEELIKGVRLANVARIFAEFWIEGSRNELNMALAGLLWRLIQVSTQGMILSRNDCEALIETILEITGDNDPSRMNNVHRTWDKLDNDAEARVSGGGKIVEAIGKKNMDLVYRLLSDDQDAELLSQEASKFAIWYGRGALIDLEAVKKGTPDCVMSKDAAMNSMGHRKIKLADKTMPLVQWLYSSVLVPRVNGVTNDPSTTEILLETEDGMKVNQWTGFAVKPSPDPVSLEDIKPFTDYMFNIVCSGKQDRYEWMMSWLANLFQHPAKKSKVGVVLTGKQGAGKSFLGSQIVAPLIGRRGVAEYSTMEGIVGKFNMLMANKLWVQCNEAAMSQQRKAYTDIKSIIDSAYIQIEPKGVNAYELPFHGRVFITSNRDDAVKMDVDDDERRFMFMKVSNDRHKDLKYWDFMHEWTPKNLDKIMRLLLEYNYDFKLISRPLSTVEKRDAQAQQLPVEYDWVLSRLEEGYPISAQTHQYWWQAFVLEKGKQDGRRLGIDRTEWPTHVNIEALQADLLAFSRLRGESYATHRAQAIVKLLIPLGPQKRLRVAYFEPRMQQEIQERKYVSEFPSRADLVAHIKAVMGSAVSERVEEAELNWGNPNDLNVDEVASKSRNVVKF